MSKPLAVKEMHAEILTIRTTNGDSRIVLDQTVGVDDTIQITTNLFSRGILLKNDPVAFLEIRGGNAGFNVSNGNLQIQSSQLLMSGSGKVAQNMLTVDNKITVSPAAADYPEMNTTNAPGINVISRVNVVTPGGGTTIHSIVASSPNVDGREIWFQNLGTGPLVFPDESGSGTAGGLIRTPGASYTVPPGGGVGMMFDATASVDGLWLVRGI